MTFQLEITDGGTVDDVARLFADYGDKVVDKARVAATNKMMSQVRTGVRKDIRAATGVPSKELTKRFKLHRAKRNKKTARLFIGVMPVNAIKFGAKQTRRGVSYRGGPGGRVSNKGAFIQTMPSGHRGVFKRRHSQRLPIDEQRVAIAPAAIRSSRRHQRVVIPQRFPAIFERELGFRTSREIARRGLAA